MSGGFPLYSGFGLDRFLYILGLVQTGFCLFWVWFRLVSVYSGFGLDRCPVYSGLGLDRCSVYSGLGLDWFLVYSVFGLYMFPVYSWFGLDWFPVYSALGLYWTPIYSWFGLDRFQCVTIKVLKQKLFSVICAIFLFKHKIFCDILYYFIFLFNLSATHTTCISFCHSAIRLYFNPPLCSLYFKLCKPFIRYEELFTVLLRKRIKMSSGFRLVQECLI